MYSDDERYFFLVNDSNNIVLIDRNAKIIESFGVFTPTESNASLPDFKGSNLYYDSVFEGTDAFYIVRKNKEQYDIYRYGAQ